MTLSVIGSPGAGEGTSIALPTHAAGDDIYICSYVAGSDTTPSKPAAGGTVPSWVDVVANPGANLNAMRVCHAVATASNHTSGVWGGSLMAVIVIRGQDASPVGGNAGAGGSGSEAIAPAITLANADGSSMILEFYGHAGVTAWAAAPSGYTRRAAAVASRGGGIALNTKTTTTSDGAVTQALSTGSAGGYRGVGVEVIVSGGMPGPGADDGDFFMMF